MSYRFNVLAQYFYRFIGDLLGTTKILKINIVIFNAYPSKFRLSCANSVIFPMFWLNSFIDSSVISEQLQKFIKENEIWLFFIHTRKDSDRGVSIESSFQCSDSILLLVHQLYSCNYKNFFNEIALFLIHTVQDSDWIVSIEPSFQCFCSILLLLHR